MFPGFFGNGETIFAEGDFNAACPRNLNRSGISGRQEAVSVHVPFRNVRSDRRFRRIRDNHRFGSEPFKYGTEKMLCFVNIVFL